MIIIPPHKQGIIDLAMLGLTIAIVVYTVRIERWNEIRVRNGNRTNMILAEIADNTKGNK